MELKPDRATDKRTARPHPYSRTKVELKLGEAARPGLMPDSPYSRTKVELKPQPSQGERTIPSSYSRTKVELKRA